MAISFVLASVLAYLFWAVSNLFCRFVMTRERRSIISYMFILSVECALSLLILLFIPLHNLSWQLVCFGIGAGLIGYLGIVPYLKAIQVEEVSRLIPLWLLTPLFVLIFTSIFGEKLTGQQYFAFVLIMLGGLILVLKEVRTFTLSKALPFMLAAAFFGAVQVLVADELFKYVTFWDGFMLGRIGLASFALCVVLVPRWRKEAFSFVNKQKKISSYIFSGELISSLAAGFYFYAISVGVAALVSALQGLESIFVFVLSLGVSFLFPKILHEDLSLPSILSKGGAIILMVAGTLLL
ncbi:MAG: DMT family transporter [Nanoarchaeota archaeon]